MTTASSAARVAWLALSEHAAALAEDALPAWENLDAEARARLVADAEVAIGATSTMGEYFGQWLASRVSDGWTHGASLDFAAKTSPMLVDASSLSDAQVSRVTLWHSVCRAYWRALP